MPWYVVWRNQQGKVVGFITEDEEEMPKEWDTEDDARDAMVGHLLELYSTFIEL